MLRLGMKKTLNKSCVVNQDKTLSEYTQISCFCFVKIGHIQKFRVFRNDARLAVTHRWSLLSS